MKKGSKAGITELGSVSRARQKADNYAKEDHRDTNRKVKLAILKELNSQLIVKPQVLHESEYVDKESRIGKDTASHYTKLSAKNALLEQRPPAARTSGYIPKSIPVSRHSKIPIQRSTTQRKTLQGKGRTEILGPVRTNNYDWHKKGRLNEIRIRYIARKYSKIWSKRVFGRISPSEARAYCNIKLLKNVLRDWQDLWWNGRKGWKLNIRAEYHNRYRLWQNAFKAWKLYVILEKQKDVKLKLAVKFDEDKVLQRAMSGIKIYLEQQKKKKRSQDKAVSFMKISMSRFFWKRWKFKCLEGRLEKALEFQALQFWAYSMKNKMLQIWLVQFDLKKEEHHKERQADAVLHSKLISKCFNGMVGYTRTRRTKQSIAAHAVNHYHEHLKRNLLNVWYTQLYRRIEIKELEERIDFMGRKFKLRRWFVKWTAYIDYQHKEYIKTEIAISFYITNLKKHCIKALKDAAKQRKLKVQMNVKAENFYVQMRVSFFWNRWLTQCDESEELKAYPITKVARSHFRKALLMKSILQWMKYTSWRRKRKQQYADVDEYFREKALPRYFNRLRVYTEQKLSKKENTEEADEFRRELLHAKSFYSWLKKTRLQQDVRMLERMAILHSEEVLKGKCLMKWKCAKEALFDDQRKEVISDSHLRRNLLNKFFVALHSHSASEKTRRQTDIKAYDYNRNRLLLVCFGSWIKYVQLRCVKHKKVATATFYRESKLLGKVIHQWKVYVEQRKLIYWESERRGRANDKFLLSLAFHRWQINVHSIKDESYKDSISRTHVRKCLLQKVFDSWRQYAVILSHRRRETKERVMRIQTILNRGKLHRTFNALREFQSISQESKRKNKVAAKHYKKTQKKKVVIAWKAFLALSFRKLLLQRQASVLYTTRSLSMCLRTWKRKFRLSTEERNKTNVALWWWSITLQRKALFCWIDYIHDKKKTKRRISDALQLRRNLLLEKCTRQWVKFSTDMMEFRSKVAQGRQVETSLALHRKVRKYAMHWYNMTKRRKDHGINRPNKMQTLTKSIDGSANTRQPFTGQLSVLLERNISKLAVVLPQRHQINRPQPRKPDYLRESFDLKKLLESAEADNDTQSEDEHLPREPPPVPRQQSRLSQHPLKRRPSQDSVMFLASSDGEDGTLRATKPQEFQPPRLKKKIIQKSSLLPPSAFKMPIKYKKPFEKQMLEKKQDEHVTLLNKTSKLSNVSTNDIQNEIVFPDSQSDSEDIIDSVSDYNTSTSDSDDDTDNEEKPVLTSSINQEVASITQKLTHFHELQNRQRLLKSQLLHLRNWIQFEREKRSSDDLKQDEDYKLAVEHKSEIQIEWDNLETTIKERRPEITKLTQRVQELKNVHC